MVTVYFASAVRQRTGVGETEVQYEGNVQGLLDQLATQFGQAFVGALYRSGGGKDPTAHTADQTNVQELNGAVNIYVDGTDIRFLEQLSTVVGPTSTVDLVPAVSGG